MSRTDLDPATLVRSLRRMAGDGSVEWVMEPIQAAVLLDIADMLDESAKLREDRDGWKKLCVDQEVMHVMHEENLDDENAKLRELIRHLYTCMCHVDADGNYECDSCEYDNAEGKCDYERQLDELGIEVGA